MNLSHAIDAIENGADDQQVAMQHAINEGSAWRFQGSFGRAMMGAIESGTAMLGKIGHRDYWGNYVPSRTEVQQGTKGSYDYVAERMGAEHAEAMSLV